MKPNKSTKLFALILLFSLISSQFLAPVMALPSQKGSHNNGLCSTTTYYLRDVVITPPYKELNLTAGDIGTSESWVVDGPGIYTSSETWATEPMSDTVNVDGQWNFTLYIEKHTDTSFDPLLRADIYTYDGVGETLFHEGITSVSIDQIGVTEYRWSEDVSDPAVVQSGDSIVVKFILDASDAPDLEYMDQPDELTMEVGTVTGYPENAGEGGTFNLTEESGEVINETRYLRSDETAVNNLTAYSLGTGQSESSLQSTDMVPGGDHFWGITVSIRHDDETETEITDGQAVAIVSRSGGGEGLQSNTWQCPETLLSPTDSIVIRLYQDRNNDPPETLVAEFTTEPLGATQLDAAIWTVNYYTVRQGNNIYVIWGHPDYNTSIDGFQWSTREQIWNKLYNQPHRTIPTEATGLSGEATYWAAMRIELNEGEALGMAAYILDQTTYILGYIYTDGVGGATPGSRIGETEQIDNPGPGEWIGLSYTEPVQLDGGHYWIILEVRIPDEFTRGLGRYDGHVDDNAWISQDSMTWSELRDHGLIKNHALEVLTSEIKGYALDARMEVRDIPDGETHLLEYKIDTEQSEFQLRVSDDGGVTYGVIIHEGLPSGTFSRPLAADEVADGILYLQISDRGLNDAEPHSVEIDYVRVRTIDNISLHYNYPVGEYSSHLEIPFVPPEPVVDYISIVDSAGTGRDNITDGIVDVGFEIIGYAASFNYTHEYIGDVSVNWSVDNLFGANAHTQPSDSFNSTFHAGDSSGVAYWNASYFYDGAWYNDSVVFTIIEPQKPEINDVAAVPDPQFSGGYVNISCSVVASDDIAGVWVNITDPDGGYTNNSMIPASGNLWYWNDTYDMIGEYDFIISVMDDMGIWNRSDIHTFTIIEFVYVDKFEFDTIVTPQIVGQAFEVTITAYYNTGDIATDYQGTASLSDTTGTITPLTTDFVDGVWTGDVTIDLAMDDVNITATCTDDATITGTSDHFDVVELVELSYFEFDTIVTPQIAGEAFEVTITAYYNTGDIATDYQGTASLSDTTGTITPLTTDFVDGVWTGDVTIEVALDDVNITATCTDDATITGTSDHFDVIVPLLSHFEITEIHSPQVAGIPFTLTVTAINDIGGVATNYQGTASLIDTTFTITPETTEFTDGVWVGSVMISMAHPDVSIFAEDNGLTGESNPFQVIPGMVQRVDISPSDDMNIKAGDSIQFNAEAFDAYDNLIADEPDYFSWENADTSGLFYREMVGAYGVSASFEAVKSETVMITVQPAEAVSIRVTPHDYTLQVGYMLAFTSTASDAYGNNFDVTSDTAFNIDDDAGGMWFDNVYSAEMAGKWNVTGVYGTLEDTVTLNVEPPSVDRIAIVPLNMTLDAGQTVEYRAEAYDEFGNYVSDVTAFTRWKLDDDAGGMWDGSVYTSEFAGEWTVIATYGKATDSTILTVEPGELDHIRINPQESRVAAGASQEYTATSHDIFGNMIDDVTQFVVWSIEEGAGGRWTQNIYHSWTSGEWIVNASYGPYNDEAYLVVEQTELDPERFAIFIVSGNNQVETAGTQLQDPMIVEVRDHFGNPVGKGWIVWFNITTQGLNGDGELSGSSIVLTGDNGRASVFWTLDSARGNNTLKAEIRGTGGSKETTFTAVGTLPEFIVELSVNERHLSPGDVVIFSILYENTGTESSAEVRITFELHGKLIYVSNTSEMSHTVTNGVYTWYFYDVDVGRHRFDVVCRVEDELHQKYVITNSVMLEYTDSRGRNMGYEISEVVELEIELTVWDRIFWPWPLLPLILISGYIFWIYYKKVEVKDVFLIYSSGLLIAHQAVDERTGMDEDIFSGMLSVIQDFIKDSFRDEENYGIKRLEFGDNRILVEKGKYTFMAVVLSGRVVKPIVKKMESTLKKIESRYEDELDGWDGDMENMAGIDEFLSRLF